MKFRNENTNNGERVHIKKKYLSAIDEQRLSAENYFLEYLFSLKRTATSTKIFDKVFTHDFVCQFVFII